MMEQCVLSTGKIFKDFNIMIRVSKPNHNLSFKEIFFLQSSLRWLWLNIDN